jgi:hypothetical protein
MKTTTRFHATATAFGNFKDLIDANFVAVHDYSSGLETGNGVVKLNGKSVYSKDFSFHCKTWSDPIEDAVIPLVSAKTSIPIYVASVDFDLHIVGSLKARLDGNLCAQPSAKLAFRADFGLTASGFAGVTLFGMVTGQAALSGKVNYSGGAEARALDPVDGTCKLCAGLYDGNDVGTLKMDMGLKTKMGPKNVWNVYTHQTPAHPYGVIDGLSFCYNLPGIPSLPSLEPIPPPPPVATSINVSTTTAAIMSSTITTTSPFSSVSSYSESGLKSNAPSNPSSVQDVSSISRSSVFTLTATSSAAEPSSAPQSGGGTNSSVLITTSGPYATETIASSNKPKENVLLNRGMAIIGGCLFALSALFVFLIVK